MGGAPRDDCRVSLPGWPCLFPSFDEKGARRVADGRALLSLVRPQFCEVMWVIRSILQPRSTKMSGDVLLQCQARSLGLYPCLVRNSFKPIVIFSRGCSDFPTQLSDSFRKFGGCAFVFCRETDLFFTSHSIVVAPPSIATILHKTTNKAQLSTSDSIAEGGSPITSWTGYSALC